MPTWTLDGEFTLVVQFPKLVVSDASVHIIQSRDHILNTYAEEISQYAEVRMVFSFFPPENYFAYFTTHRNGSLASRSTPFSTLGSRRFTRTEWNTLSRTRMRRVAGGSKSSRLDWYSGPPASVTVDSGNSKAN
jgi:hypothetical protein